MQQLKLENKEYILKYLKIYSEKNSIDTLVLMEDIYKVITKQVDGFDNFDTIVFDLKDKIKKDTIWETEEELFHVVSWELDRLYTDLVFKNSDKKDIDEVFAFLDKNYFDIFKEYYTKKGYVSDADYHECVASVYNNFTVEKEVADILVGKWIEDNVIKNNG